MNDIILPRSSSWYYENGYLTIDLELFGKYLCAVFNEFLEGYYYFQKFTPTLRTDKERPVWQQGEERKNLAIISSILYDENYQQNYNRVREVPMAYPRPQNLEPFTLESREYLSIFSKSPLKLDENEFLLYFGDYAFENVQICLGNVENGQFIPNDCLKNFPANEIDHANPVYPFVEDFIKAIFYYKVLNKKPNLDQSDMELILENFGINREDKMQSLVEILKNMQEESTKILLGNSSIGDVLKLQRKSKKAK